MNFLNPITSKHLLLVEGDDEVYFFESLLKFLNINNIQQHNFCGKDRFKSTFPALASSEKFNEVTHIGFIRDAEKLKAKSAFDSICNILNNYNINTPSINNPIIKNDLSVGIFIMPNNNDEGMLEDLCIKSLIGKSVNDDIDNYISSITDNNRIYGDKSKFCKSKAHIQTYLASCSPIRNRLGLGAKRDYFNFSHSCFNKLIRFLNDLFVN